jgi:tetratricopeptide (TPR) repeat protein
VPGQFRPEAAHPVRPESAVPAVTEGVDAVEPVTAPPGTAVEPPLQPDAPHQIGPDAESPAYWTPEWELGRAGYEQRDQFEAGDYAAEAFDPSLSPVTAPPASGSYGYPVEAGAGTGVEPVTAPPSGGSADPSTEPPAPASAADAGLSWAESVWARTAAPQPETSVETGRPGPPSAVPVSSAADQSPGAPAPAQADQSPGAPTPDPPEPAPREAEEEGHGLGWLLSMSGLGAPTPVPLSEPAVELDPEPAPAVVVPVPDEDVHPVSAAPARQDWFAPVTGSHPIVVERTMAAPESGPSEQPPRRSDFEISPNPEPQFPAESAQAEPHQPADSAAEEPHQPAGRAQDGPHQRAASTRDEPHQPAASKQDEPHQPAASTQHGPHQPAASTQHEPHQLAGSPQDQSHQPAGATPEEPHQPAVSTAEPETAAGPDTSTEPETAADPRMTATSETAPETAPAPETATTPETAATEPKTAPGPETAAAPETAANEPETAATPEAAAGPETAAPPETATGPETASASEGDGEMPASSGEQPAAESGAETDENGRTPRGAPPANVGDDGQDDVEQRNDGAQPEPEPPPAPEAGHESAMDETAADAAGDDRAAEAPEAPPEAAAEPVAAPPAALHPPIRQRRDQNADPGRRRPDPEQILLAYRWMFDPHTLREQVDDSDQVWVVIDRLTDKLEYAERDAVRARLLSLRAVALRLTGDLDAALADGRAALEHAQGAGELTPTSIVRARLGHILQWRGEFAEADRLYAEADSPELPARLRAEIHELAGRSAYDQGRFLEAVNHFETALDLRRGGDPEMVERIEMALDMITRRTADGWGPYPRSREEILGQPPARRPVRNERSGLWGYAGAVPPRYAQAQPFAEGVAWVRRPEAPSWELIDEHGELLIDASSGYRAAGRFAEGLAWVSRDDAGGWYAIDRQNRVIVPGGFEDAKPFRHGFALVRRGGWGAIDRHGRVTVQPRYRAFATSLASGGPVDGFTAEGLAVVDAGDRYGVVDRTGQLVVAPVHAAVVIHPTAFLIADKYGLWGALGRDGEPLVPLKYRERADVLDDIDRLRTDSRPLL